MPDHKSMPDHTDVVAKLRAGVRDAVRQAFEAGADDDIAFVGVEDIDVLLDELTDAAMSDAGNYDIGEDNDGQVIIYTGVYHNEVPADWPVQPVDPDWPGAATCGTCGRSWDDSVSTSMTPVPSGRCPFEQFHD